MRDGHFGSFAGDVDNLAIAYNTAIDSFVGGTAGTKVTVNANADTITDAGTSNIVRFLGTNASYVVATLDTARVTVTSVATGIVDMLSDVQTLVFSDKTVKTGSVACYLAGTRIATGRGEVAVEDLTIGDHLWN